MSSASRGALTTCIAVTLWLGLGAALFGFGFVHRATPCAGVDLAQAAMALGVVNAATGLAYLVRSAILPCCVAMPTESAGGVEVDKQDGVASRRAQWIALTRSAIRWLLRTMTGAAVAFLAWLSYEVFHNNLWARMAQVSVTAPPCDRNLYFTLAGIVIACWTAIGLYVAFRAVLVAIACASGKGRRSGGSDSDSESSSSGRHDEEEGGGGTDADEADGATEHSRLLEGSHDGHSAAAAAAAAPSFVPAPVPAPAPAPVPVVAGEPAPMFTGNTLATGTAMQAAAAAELAWGSSASAAVPRS